MKKLNKKKIWCPGMDTGLVYRFMTVFFLLILFLPLSLVARDDKSKDKGLKEATVSTPNSLMQKLKVTGVVTDSKTGEALPGVNIRVEGTNTGTITDANGKYGIEAPTANAVLVFSFIGYTNQSIPVNGSTNIDVKLISETLGLDEVVVIGYGTQRKATLTGSVSEVKGVEILKSPSLSIANNIAGRISGVITTNSSGEPGRDDPTLRVRGISTFSGSAAPLIVIDGVAGRPGGFSRLNSNDIESITVLKDASAAIYGAQAANGVILVTTKRGTSGETVVSLKYNHGFNTFMFIPERTNSFEFATLVNEDREYRGLGPTYTDEELQKYKDGSDPIGYPNTDWLKLIYKPVSHQSSLNLSLSGGDEKTKYYGSFGKVNQGGQFNSDAYNYDQYNLSLNFDVQANDIIKISFDTQLRYSDRKGAASSTLNVFRGLFFSLPTQVAKYPDGRLGYTQPVLNPLATTTEIGGFNREYDFYALNTFRYRLDIPTIDGLFFDGFISADLQNSDSKSFGKQWDTWSYNRRTQEYALVPQRTSSEGLASLSQDASNSLTLTINSKLNYRRTFNLHTINSFIAFEQRKFTSRGFGADRRNYITDNLPELDFGSGIDQRNYGNSSNSTRRNFFGRINYDYNSKYILEVQMRYDGSDKFSKERRWGLFPSVSAGWSIAGENWAKGFLGDNELKLTASYGILGNDNIDPYQYLQFYNIVLGGLILDEDEVPTIYPGVLANPDFTWETAKSSNIGLSGTFLSKSFNYQIEVFKQVRSDILGNRNATVPSLSGLYLPVVNYGKMQNQGIELQLGFAKQFGEFRLNSRANFTYSQNKVLVIDEAESLPEYQKEAGRSVYTMLLYKSDGLFKSQEDIDQYLSEYSFEVGIDGSSLRPGDVKFKDYNNDGIINSLDMVREQGGLSAARPNMIFGLSTSLNWKNFDFSFLLQGIGDTKRWLYPLSSSQFNYYKFLYDGRSTPDKVTDQPTVAGSAFNRTGWLFSDHPFFYRSNSYVRLRNVEFGYTVTKLPGKLNQSSARLYVNGSNLLTFPRIKDYDPEINGTDAYPLIRTINIGANITF